MAVVRGEMRVILGIDAAWTQHEPSGVAVVAFSRGSWRCCGVAPSYDAFLSLAGGNPVAWRTGRFAGSVPQARSLLDAAQKLAGAPVDVVAVDMPVSRVPITGRRTADNRISSFYGRRGCATHSPSPTRPGPLGHALTQEFNNAGYSIAHALESPGERMRLVEVYPHPALLTLLARDYRVPYKVGKSRKYWPNTTVKQRITALLNEFHAIHQALVQVLGATGFVLPAVDDVPALSSLKRYEDALDAIVSAWVGVRYAEGNAIPYGDDKTAIWCP